jgi:hypothetical protein
MFQLSPCFAKVNEKMLYTSRSGREKNNETAEGVIDTLQRFRSQEVLAVFDCSHHVNSNSVIG